MLNICAFVETSYHTKICRRQATQSASILKIGPGLRRPAVANWGVNP